MRSRQIVGLALCLISIVSLAALAFLALDTYRNPEPFSNESDDQGVHIRITAARTRTIFNGDCRVLAWGIDNAGEILLNGAPVLPTGERAHCDGTPPQWYITPLQGGEIFYNLPYWVLFEQWYAWVLLVLGGVCAIAGGFLLGVHRLPLLQHPAVQWAFVIAFAVVWVFVLDVFTNSLNIYRYVWDHYHYIDMAENGIIGNGGLVAPYAYRPAIPMLARLIGHFTERSVIGGFRLVTYAGMISQLVLVFVLARQFTRKNWIAWMAMIVIGISTFHVKFLLFDIYRPDSLAYSLILIGMLAFIQRQRMVASGTSFSTGRVALCDVIIIATSAAGLLVREFCALPAALLAFRLLLQSVRTRQVFPFLESVVVVGVVMLAYWLPHEWIVVGRTDQLLDSNLSNVVNIMTNGVRNYNILLGIAIYLLPLLVILTPDRAQRLWARLNSFRADLILYSLLVLFLTMFGGSDIDRFVVYLFVPLVLMLVLLLDEGIAPAEVVYMLVATAVYNRILAPIPQESLDAYLDFYVVWHDRISPIAYQRGGELLLWLIGAAVVRLGLTQFHRPNPSDIKAYSA